MSFEPSLPGLILARGVGRHLREHGFMSLEEFVPDRGLRLDVMALGPKGEFWIVECKSSRADFMSDAKWRGYLEWSDRYFWAVAPGFPVDILPPETGLIVADGFGAEVVRMPDATPLAPSRRRALTLRFARCAASRLQWMRDPMLGG